MYIAHIAWSLGLILVAGGFVALHFAVRERSGHLRTAGWLLVVGGGLGLVCNGYYSLKYSQQGVFAAPMMMRQSNMMPMSGSPMSGSMMRGAMPGRTMDTNPPPPPQ